MKLQELEMETVNLRNELSNLQKTIADGAIQFDVKGIKTKVAACQLIGWSCTSALCSKYCL
jgi:Tfp pilus assembly protein PilV